MMPCRILDTRNPDGPYGGPMLSANQARSFDISNSSCGPFDGFVVAFSLNVTVVPQGALHYLTVWPSSEAQPFVSTLNSLDGRTKANASTMGAGSTGDVSFFATDDTHLVVDINGYFVASGTTTGLAFYPLAPCRVADTRDSVYGSLERLH